jgi:steroid 5-alpha reductase family enzyme
VQWVAALPAALLSVLALLTTLLTGTRRFAYYGLALLLIAAAAALLGWGPGAPILAGGLLVLASGITLLLRFLSASSGPLEETP